jgi:UDP-N-acetylmuramoylalanine--D-glutamate ligase
VNVDFTPAAVRGLTVADLVGRDVAILGAGREGMAVLERLRTLAPGQDVALYNETPLEARAAADLGAHDRLVVGPFDAARLARHDVLVRSPGISPYRQALRGAADAGVRFTTGTNLWLAENPGARTLCVTGTKGKSTTTALLHHLLEAAGERVAMAGNIGIPLIACDASSADWWVVELSSYQLCDLQESVWLGVLLNLSDEHLDWHGSAEAYRRDKLRLASLTPPGRLVANGASPVFRAALADRADVHWYGVSGAVRVENGVLCDTSGPLPALPAVPGVHNLENLAAALTVADLVGRRPEHLERVLADFRGLPHRQRRIGERQGRQFVDDSLSTTPVATLAALEALAGQRVTVLVGGLDRGVDWSAHADAFVAARPHAVIGLPDSGRSVLGVLSAGGLDPVGGLHVADDMAEAVGKALDITPVGGTVLLSPGAPSFPHFSDYRARAAAFANAAGIKTD